MMRVINLSLLAHPLNWLTLLIWLSAIALLVHAASGQMNGKATPSVAVVA